MMNNFSNADLGRMAVQAVRTATNNKYNLVHYVNRTPKYISIKLDIDHLSESELRTATALLRTAAGDRFIKIYNNTANPTNRFGPPGSTYKTDKVNVRFTQ